MPNVKSTSRCLMRTQTAWWASMTLSLLLCQHCPMRLRLCSLRTNDIDKSHLMIWGLRLTKNLESTKGALLEILQQSVTELVKVQGKSLEDSLKTCFNYSKFRILRLRYRKPTSWSVLLVSKREHCWLSCLKYIRLKSEDTGSQRSVRKTDLWEILSSNLQRKWQWRTQTSR